MQIKELNIRNNSSPNVKLAFSYRKHRKLVIPLPCEKLLLDFDEIIYVEADGSYAKVYTEKTLFILSKTLKWVEEKLDNNFYRIHKSFLINLKEVKVLSIKNQNMVMSSGKALPISRTKKKEIYSLFE